jgi:pyruvate/2-oxoacid:ferredoxin oxidoreductase alpha subunit
MLKQIEGSRAVAEAVAMCRPDVICAYPITPQTHIVEALGAMVKKGDLAPTPRPPVRIRLLQGLRHLRSGMPLRSHRDAARADLT